MLTARRWLVTYASLFLEELARGILGERWIREMLLSLQVDLPSFHLIGMQINEIFAVDIEGNLKELAVLEQEGRVYSLDELEQFLVGATLA